MFRQYSEYGEHPYYFGPPTHSEAPKYGCFMFLLDMILLAATGGLWIFFIIYRQLRNRNR